MPLQPFQASQALSLGVELELQLVSLSDFDLTEASPDMLELLRRKPFPGTVTPEVTESMIEVATSVHTEYATLLAQLQAMQGTLVRAAERLNVGCSSADEALFLLHALNRYVPHFIALSASSPFVQGKDTLFQSARLNSVFAFPLSGRAPFLLRWDAFQSRYFAKMESTGVVKSMKDFYWDIRPKPEYGTIELRVCDTPLSVERAAALACYLQALCLYLLERREAARAEDDYLVYNYNRFQACRFGLQGTVVHPKTYVQTPLAEDILDALNRVLQQAEALRCTPALHHLERALQTGSDASLLRHAFARGGNVEGMVDVALRRFALLAARP